MSNPAGPAGPFHDLAEMAWETPAGEFLVVESTEANPEGTSYIRIVDKLGPKGKELVYWVCDEWQEDPVGVMGAVFGAAFGGVSR